MLANILTTCSLAKLLDLVWPRTCAVCARAVDRPGRHLCSDCVNRLPFIATRGCCRKCGREVAGLKSDFLCEDCRRYRPQFDRVASALRFEGIARELINAFKFRSSIFLRNDLADVLEAVTTARFKLDAFDLIAPIPSTFWHRLDRGYNPVDYVAAALAKRLNKPYFPHLLKRINSPQRQGRLNEAERRQNVIGTFKVRKPNQVCGKKVLIVDDIMTTGSTLSEAAAELKRAGAQSVVGVTLARAIRS